MKAISSDLENFMRVGKKNVDLYILEHMPFRLLIKVLIYRFNRKIRSFRTRKFPLEPATIYQGVQVFHRNDLHGAGLTLGEDFLRAFHLLGISQVERCFEFSAGPGYIGYMFLANAICRKLTLADINPHAVECAMYTREFNGLDELVNIYQSDVLESIPSEEKWDLVVGNPPNFDKITTKKDRLIHSSRELIACDKGWKIHRRFYNTVKNHMNPHSLVVMLENRKSGSTADIFIPMIEDGGGKFVRTLEGEDVRGNSNSVYYVVSSW